MSCTVLKTKMKQPKGLLDDVQDMAALSYLQARSFFSTLGQAKKPGGRKKGSVFR